MITIRKARAEDIPALEVFQKELYGEWFDSYHEDISQAVSAGRVWVAAEGGDLLGYQLCDLFGPSEKNFPNSIFLSELLVVSGRRRHGIGSLLIRAALDEPWSAEYRYFSLTHDPDEANLTSYYRKFGFVEGGKTDAGNVKMTRAR